MGVHVDIVFCDCGARLHVARAWRVFVCARCHCAWSWSPSVDDWLRGLPRPAPFRRSARLSLN
jgi:hypothetical protein